MEAPRKGNLYLYLSAALLVAAAVQLMDSLTLLQDIKPAAGVATSQLPAKTCQTSSCGRVSLN